MVRKFGPFDTSQFYEVENRRMQRALAIGDPAATGFVKTGQGAVTAGTGAELVIAAYPDGALIDGLYVENPDPEPWSLTTNSENTNPRIDRLVMRLDMTAKTIAPFQIVGTPAASPSVPPLVNTGAVVDLPLCRYTMPGSASAQNPGSIVDERFTTGGPRPWVDLVTTDAGYLLQPASAGVWETMQFFNAATGLIPAGRTLDVEFKAPACNAGDAFFYVRLLINGVEFDTAAFSACWAPVRLDGSFVPATLTTATLIVQAQRTGTSGDVRASGGAPVRLRYRIV